MPSLSCIFMGAVSARPPRDAASFHGHLDCPHRAAGRDRQLLDGPSFQEILLLQPLAVVPRPLARVPAAWPGGDAVLLHELGYSGGAQAVDPPDLRLALAVFPIQPAHLGRLDG